MKFFLTVCAVLLCSCRSSPSVIEYFPLEVGNQWEYREELVGFRSCWEVGRETWSVAAKRGIDGVSWYQLAIADQYAKPELFLVRLERTRLMWRLESKGREQIYVDFARPVGEMYDAKPIEIGSLYNTQS